MTHNHLHQSTDAIEPFEVIMFKTDMDSIPSCPLPAGYSIQSYKFNSDDGQKWAEIATSIGGFESVQQGCEYFINRYLNDKDGHLLSERLYFLINPEGRYVGATMAWIGEFDGEIQNALYWVMIIPEHQGKKLAKALVSTVLKKVAEYSKICYLGSHTTRWKAVNMYDDFGFKPYMKIEHSEKAWTILGDLCKKNFLVNK